MTAVSIFASLSMDFGDILEYAERRQVFDTFGESERERISGICRTDSKALSLGGLIALRCLTERFAPSGVPLKIARDGIGKPYFLSDAAGEFSISHSGAISVAAYSSAGEGKIGVDIEKIDAKRDIKRISDRFFCEAEKEYLSKPDNCADAFWRIWTAKEALTKFNGDLLANTLKGGDVLSSSERYAFAHFSLSYENSEYIMCVCRAKNEDIQIISNIENIEIFKI